MAEAAADRGWSSSRRSCCDREAGRVEPTVPLSVGDRSRAGVISSARGACAGCEGGLFEGCGERWMLGPGGRKGSVCCGLVLDFERGCCCCCMDDDCAVSPKTRGEGESTAERKQGRRRQSIYCGNGRQRLQRWVMCCEWARLCTQEDGKTTFGGPGNVRWPRGLAKAVENTLMRKKPCRDTATTAQRRPQAATEPASCPTNDNT